MLGNVSLAPKQGRTVRDGVSVSLLVGGKQGSMVFSVWGLGGLASRGDERGLGTAVPISVGTTTLNPKPWGSFLLFLLSTLRPRPISKQLQRSAS